MMSLDPAYSIIQPLDMNIFQGLKVLHSSLLGELCFHSGSSLAKAAEILPRQTFL